MSEKAEAQGSKNKEIFRKTNGSAAKEYDER